MKVLRSLIISAALLSVSLVLSSLSSLAQTPAVRARVMQAVDLHNLVTLHGNVHPLARPEFDQGVAPDDLPMERMLLVLQRGADQESALRQLLDDQQVKSSPRFHQWLTPEQFGQQFGPADSDLQAVTDWLAGQGFQVARVSAGRTVIEFSGTAGLVRQVLGTEIHKFRVNGEDRWANTADPQIPAALAPVVAGFGSLNNFPRKPLYQSLGTFTRSKLTGEVQPLFTYPAGCRSGSGPCYIFAVGPTDFATIYNVLPLWNAATPTDGTGVTIAVVGETNINPQDVADFRHMFGFPVNPPHIILNGPDPGIISDEPEADLDVQWSGAVAKGATIDFVVSESTETTPGVDLSALYIIDNNLAPVMSESYGSCEASLGVGGNQFYNTLWEQAAAQGITVLMASGDSGPAGCDSANALEIDAQYGLGVSGLASTPFNVAVGGTDFNDASDLFTYWNTTSAPLSQLSAKSYIPESTWNDSCAAFGLLGCTPPPSSTYLSDGLYLLAGGGGPSSCINPTGTFPSVTCSEAYSKPSWQSGTGVPLDGARDIPDVSLFAGNDLNFSFYVTCQMDANARNGGSSTSCNLNAPYTNFQGGSGTSASVQAFAGIMALVNQRYGRQGNANYVLYPMAAKSGASCTSSTAPATNSSCIFYDVTVGNNSVICQGGTRNCSSASSGQYGVMVSGGSAAYPTTTGYDLATGLGSVNVTNLVTNWTSSFTPSTTMLSFSTNPPTNPLTLTHGQPINFAINVASGSGTPTGDVSLLAQTGSSLSGVTGIGPFTLSGGGVSGSTNMLPGGTYNVTAHYAGDGTFAASDSPLPGIPVTVGKENSQTRISLVTFDLNTGVPSHGATTTPYGSPYVLRMDVMHSSDGNPCASPTTGLISYPCPTGNLTVSPAPTDENPPQGTVAGHYTLNSLGYAEDEPIQQSPGTYNFLASYAGDNSYTGSASSTLPVTITKAATTTTITSTPASPLAGAGASASVTVTVTTQSNGVAPSGLVQLYNGSTNLGGGGDYAPSSGSATAYASLTAVVSATLTGGTDTLTAQYPGDNNYASSTSAPVTITVADFTPSSTPSSINVSAPGQSATATITVASVSGFAGTVYLSTGGICFTGATCTLSPTSVTATGTSPGQSTLTITTTAPSSAMPPNTQRKGPPGLRMLAGWRWLLAAMLVLVMLLSLATTRRRPAGWLFATALLIVGVWAACGGGSGGGGSNSLPPSGPIASISPASLTFNQQVVNTTSLLQGILLHDAGMPTLNVSSITIGGTNAGDFAQTNNCVGSLASGVTCSIIVTFTPAAPGSRSASLVVTDDASDSPQTVSLTGTGTQPLIKISPASLTFGNQIQYTPSTPQTLTLSNISGVPISFSSMSITGVNYIDFNLSPSTCGSGLSSGANCAVTVYFEPLSTGPRNALFLVILNGSSSQQTVSLSGTGVLPSTPPGSYTVTVQASSMGDVHLLNIPVTVQ